MALERGEWLLDARSKAVLGSASSGSRVAFDSLGNASRARWKLYPLVLDHFLRDCQPTPLSHFVLALAHVTHAMALLEAILW
jgi:hypothetical protein